MPLRHNPTTTDPSAVSRSKRGLLLLFPAISLLVTGAFLILAFGGVHGLEFSPLTFQRRSYTFFQLPLLRWQVTPVWRDDKTQSLETRLKQRGLLPRRNVSDRWDIVRVSEGGREHEADPMILTRYLDMSSPGHDQHWDRWTKENPDLANLLWPAVQEAALLQAYVLIPELFELAASATDPATFGRQVEQYMGQALADWGDELAAGQHPEIVRRRL